MAALRVSLGIGLDRSPWRVPREKFKWTEETSNELRKETKQIIPTKKSGISKQLRMLVIGPRGHGKSSLINSFASVSAKEKVTVCNAADYPDTVTTIYRSFGFPGDLEQLRVGDISGIENKKIENSKPFLDDIKLLLNGKITGGYKFRHTETISEEDEHFVAEPTVSDRIHCVILVLECSHAFQIHQHYKDSLSTLHETINKRNIPVLVVLTKADKVSPHVKSDIQNLFRCRLIQDAVNKASEQLTIPKTKVFPVVNFEEKDAYSWKDAIPIQLVIQSGLLMAKTHAHDVECS